MDARTEKLLELARDRTLSTPEKHTSNDFYGHAAVLKSFVGRPPESSTNCVIVHGPMFPSLHWDVDLRAPLPVLLTANQAACSELKGQTDQLIVAVGPLLSYAKPHLTPAELTGEKRRLGRNLLVFPSHSTHHIEARYDFAAVCREIAAIGRDFDSVTVCLYWKDILNGVAPMFAAHGFEIETAGHIFDRDFMHRLKTLFTLADAVVTYSWTSALGFAVSMKKPVMALPAKDEQFIAPQDIIDRDTLGGNTHRDVLAYKARVLALFKELRETTPEQESAIDYMWGITQTRTASELEGILRLADDMAAGKRRAVAGAAPAEIDAPPKDRRDRIPVIPTSQTLQDSCQPPHHETRSMKTIRSVFRHGKDFYGPVMLNPSTLVNAAISPSTWSKVLAFHHLLSSDEYVQYLDAYYREASARFGDHWFYLDIVNTLFAASSLLQPRRYLEIGVRRGRSVAVVAKACPTVDIVAFDMWIQGYAGMENPGPAHVQNELARMGHTGKIEFVDGDSHQTVPAYFSKNPDAEFDLITVDGDHSREGAMLDLMTVIPRLALGGVLVFDDVSHAQHPYLLEVWLEVMARHPQLSQYVFVESGFGIAFAIRMR